MISPNHSRALKIIYGRLRETEIVWVITGSLGFPLRGMEFEVLDIDLQTDAAGAYGIGNAFSESVVRKVRHSVSENIVSHFGELEIEGVKVEIMGGLQKKSPDGTWEPPVQVERHREFVPFEGLMLPVLSLEYEEQAYRKLGRTEKADRIRDWLISPR